MYLYIYLHRDFGSMLKNKTSFEKKYNPFKVYAISDWLS